MRDNEIVVEIRSKTFTVNFVSNYVSVEFSKLNKQIKRVSDISSEIDALSLAVQLGEKDNEEATKVLVERQEEIEAISEKLFPKRMELIKEILETNEHEYEPKFWERKTTPQDLNDFLYQCYVKDYDKEALKKSPVT